MEKGKEPAYKLFNMPKNQIREEVSPIREIVSQCATDPDFRQEVLTKLADLDAKVTRLLELIDKNEKR